MKYILYLLFAVSFVGNVFSQEKNSEEEVKILSLSELMKIRIKQVALLDVPHTHSKGEVMLSYHYMQMNMKDTRSGMDDVTTETVLENYMVSPEQMKMDMHMFHLMYAPSDRFTLMSMFSYNKNEMDLVMMNGMKFTTESKGFGDLQISGLYTLLEKNSGRLVGSLGLSIPIGSIDETDATPMNVEGQKLPYPMQIGSGTVDPTISTTYFVTNEKYGWGFDMRNKFRLYDNSNDYNFGNLFKATAWYSRIWSEVFITTFRVDFANQSKISGKDPDLNPMMVYTANPDNMGGTTVLGGLGFNINPGGRMKGIRFSVESKLPLYQKTSGYQMKTQNIFKLALTYVFTKS
ncbi:transporter family protein [Marinigracilibium pacificum]|uniref:Transporter n=1 Tax=Marinigracilibium pacificum TaxID=2729599 RepID=A0A848J1X8_9BACT|nr:transporter [Marinigracilibium pacificum]NMM47202.1 transporter [Marinigracilibium pacificum]